MSLIITDKILGAGEFKPDKTTKDTIVIHFTAGNNNPENTVMGWAADFVINKTTGAHEHLPVGTHFIIGGKSTRAPFDTTFDGKVYRAVPEENWIHHLGTTYPNNVLLNQKSFGIEVCNYGPIKLGPDGKYYNYVNSEVPADAVIKLDKPFKGYTYYHNITDAQLNSLKELILYLKAKYPTISLKTPLLDPANYELNDNAKKGTPGVYVHTNTRNDKFDWPPIKKLTDMLATICTKI